MRILLRIAVLLLMVGGVGAAVYQPAKDYWHERHRPRFTTLSTEQGDITEIISSTGTIQPVLSVHIGSFVSGPITQLYVDFNDEVKQGELLAEIDPRIYEASVARDRAALATRKADVQRIQARLQNAVNDEQRVMGLKSDNSDFISDTEVDQYRFSRMALEAELLVAEASVDQSEANLTNSVANLDYTKITSPVDGIVIDRKIDPGQTLAAQFQTPELFIIAPDMRKQMHIFASVDEADIGQIRKAQEAGETVSFTVYAYPGETFEGQIDQIRLSSATTQNVVTYPVVIAASNSDLKLLPGMTAEITFPIRRKSAVVKIPNAALRFVPELEHVREADRALLDGTSTFAEGSASKSHPPAGKSVAQKKGAASASSDQADRQTDKVEDPAQRSRSKHVWVRDADLLRAIPVETGISDYHFTELVSGAVTAGQELVIGLQTE